MLGLLFAVGLVGAPAGPQEPVSLQLGLEKPSILVGEPDKALLTWSATRPVAINPGGVTLLLDDGTGFRRYAESSVSEGGAWLQLPMLEPAKPWKTTYAMSVYGGLSPDGKRDFHFAFPKVGRYRVKASYDDFSTGAHRAVESNVAELKVVPPTGADAELFSKYLAQHPEYLSTWGLELADEREIATWSSLLSRYRGSPYLAGAQVHWWRRELEAARRADGSGPPGQPATLGPKVQNVLSDIEATDLDNSPFDEDRLALVAQYREGADRLGARRIRQELVRRHPQGAAAVAAKEWLESDACGEAEHRHALERAKLPESDPH